MVKNAILGEDGMLLCQQTTGRHLLYTRMSSSSAAAVFPAVPRGEAYNLFEHNCNTFSNEVAQFLTGRKIPSYITDLPSEALWSSTSTLPGLHPDPASWRELSHLGTGYGEGDSEQAPETQLHIYGSPCHGFLPLRKLELICSVWDRPFLPEKLLPAQTCPYPAVFASSHPSSDAIIF
ncbi:hypothetical protein A6R68_02620 [Neotoma lepida]|uniref:palmitoyl-protein hydrolase n=1 Tax=Neotoma lepida TaxID=56216 RepID=A0A1A6GT48_NEOLE|nr:hypothetical protein A6R68_02620 [Neotoma lepida]